LLEPTLSITLNYAVFDDQDKSMNEEKTESTSVFKACKSVVPLNVEEEALTNKQIAPKPC